MAVHLKQVVLGATATRLSDTRVPLKELTLQNNAAANMRVGDSTVSATKGILLAAGSPGGSGTFGTKVAYNTDLSEWYVFGTAGQVIDVLYIA